jgi:hypothetical protein
MTNTMNQEYQKTKQLLELIEKRPEIDTNSLNDYEVWYSHNVYAQAMIRP